MRGGWFVAIFLLGWAAFAGLVVRFIAQHGALVAWSVAAFVVVMLGRDAYLERKRRERGRRR